MANVTLELMPAVILAGGLAMRLRPLSERIPKALMDVAGKPFLAHQLALLKRHGIRHVVICAGYLGEMIEERFADGSDLGMEIDYSFDGPVALGTAGAIREALPLLPDRFFVLYGDSYLTCDYAAVESAFRRSGLRGLMTLYLNEGLYDSSNVEYHGGRVVRYDKHNRTAAMRHIDYGLGAFERSVFAAIPQGEPRDLGVVYQHLLLDNELATFESPKRFYEIGSPRGLQETSAFLSRTAVQKINC